MGKNTKETKTWVCLLGIIGIFIKLLLAVSIVLSALYTSLFLIVRLILLDICFFHVRDEETDAGWS